MENPGLRGYEGGYERGYAIAENMCALPCFTFLAFLTHRVEMVVKGSQILPCMLVFLFLA
jgi:hypothetical protein